MSIQVRISVVVDVVGALATGVLDDAVWLVDSNKRGGSTFEGTSRLKTTVKKGDDLLWTAMSLEIEAFAAIEEIEIDAAYCKIVRGFYPGTDIPFWRGQVKKDPGNSVIPYNLVFRLGSRVETFSLTGPNRPSITGGRSDGGAQ